MTATGAMLGLAIGDAMGFPTEFNDIRGILAKCGPWREMDLPAPAFITDDTQMTLAVARALHRSAAQIAQDADTLDADNTQGAENPRDARGTGRGDVLPRETARLLREQFIAWFESPDNNRAPGNTCLTACRTLRADAGLPWQRASITGSKGCGANMRVAPVGLVPGLTGEQRAGLAQLQSGLTHGHPTGLAASDLTARAVRLLNEGTSPAALPAALRHYAHQQRGVHHERWLGDLWAQAGDAGPGAYIARGWDDCLAALDRLDAAVAAGDRETDPCLATGAGWIAEEALATGLLCFLLFPDDPVTAVRRAACTSGDSDSLACLTGAFAGARHGAGAWPAGWIERLEHRDELLAFGALWDAAATTRP
ncbi:ADP-ribosylglycohydrolase family protein [Streptomyces sp. SL13]|jgi:ADP-ribosylglycohydrolase|uniref:ADP-ribosylglycohydrolase family protein n=1 Tax=Streptantibioticus silvisoli TaxID=2705255 RepID=A0AA90KHP6_9ACTN|nr:ADP-ribosylglycohydrolase family protein [Streptantibioticus silvisoli]MDI5966327.1 ADP-ribosylglycohydrolase family protein [Streptantibioticus silvisoli]MDI5971669.1 ADP-ribosylglycohydrolase family protein [Streptantibioticus silvisoli]